MRRKLVTAMVSLLAFSSARAADLTTTNYFSPDLKEEANPFVAILNFGWSGVLMTQLIGFLLIAAGLLFYARGRTKVLRQPFAGAWEFAPLCLYDRPMSPLRFLLTSYLLVQFRCDWYQVTRFLIFTATWAVVSCSFTAVFSWWMLDCFHIGWFARLYHYGIGSTSLFPLVGGLVGAHFAAAYFFVSEAAEARRALNQI